MAARFLNILKSDFKNLVGFDHADRAKTVQGVFSDEAVNFLDFLRKLEGQAKATWQSSAN